MTGSMKDRMAWSMIEHALESGELHPGGKVVELTGGSTGSSLAMVCAIKGLSAHFVTSDAFAKEKLDTMKAFGATLDVLESGPEKKITAEYFQRGKKRVQELLSDPHTFCTDQFNNPFNRAGYYGLGDEIVEDLPRVDMFIHGVGTGGSITGIAEILKNSYGHSNVQCVGVEPAKSRALSGAPLEDCEGHLLEGMGAGFVPGLFDTNLVDDVAPATDEDAEFWARELARVEGVFSGYSTGASFSVALEMASNMKPEENVVIIGCDSGLKYLGGNLYKIKNQDGS